MKKAVLFGLCAALLLSSACGSRLPLNADDSALTQLTAPDYPDGAEEQAADYEKLRSALTGFSARSASALLGGGRENGAYSPVSLYLALALSASGASGETLSELYAALGLANSSKGEVAGWVNALYRDLYGEEEYGHLYLYNSLWLSEKASFKPGFLRGAGEDYFAEIFTLDPEASLAGDPISAWVAEKTGGKLTREPVKGDFVMSLVSVIDFYGEWTSQFSRKSNTVGDFTLSDGAKVQAEYMNGETSGTFYRGEGWTMAFRSLKNGAQMAFVLPDSGVDINDLLADENALSAMLAPGDAAGVKALYGEIVWSVPKFDFQSQWSLADMLKSLGIRSAFGMDADFSETSDTKPLFLSDARQASRVTVDENGVSASAYTELFYTGAAQPQDRAEMVLNRPFAFVISYHAVSLFLGVVNNPSL